MKLNLWKSALVATCACIGAFAACAAPLQRSDVVANPAWLLHVDCDTLRPTTIGQYILAEMDKPEAKAKLAAFQSIFSFDLRTQLHGATLYGGTQLPQDAVLILYADFDPDRLVTLAKAAHDSQNSQHNQHTIYSWLDDNKKAHHGAKTRVYAAIDGSRVIFGQKETTVATALDVIDGSAASLASGNVFAELGASNNGHFVEAAARKMDLPDSDPNAAIMKLSQTVELVMGEQNQQFQGKLTLTADTDDVASHVLSIAQGINALMKLQTNNPAAVKLANAVVLNQNGSTVVGTLTLPASDAVDMMKADALRRAVERKEKHSNQ